MAVIYVDNINGNDSNTGTITTPFLTIAKAVEKAQTNTSYIILKESPKHYVLESFDNIMCSKYNISLIGQGSPAYVDIQRGCSNIVSTCNSVFVNCIFQPVDAGFTGDTRALFYVNSADTTYTKTFFNCLFKTNNGYPTQTYSFGSNFGTHDTKIYYTNCTFLNLPPFTIGTEHLNYCAYNVEPSGNIILDGSNNSQNLNAVGCGYSYYDNLKNNYPSYYNYVRPILTLYFQDQNNKNIDIRTINTSESINLNGLPLYQEGKLFVGYLKPNGSLIKNGETIIETMVLTPYFVPYEELIVDNQNKVSVKVKQDVYDLLRQKFEEYNVTLRE